MLPSIQQNIECNVLLPSYLFQGYFFILALAIFVINDVTCARKRQLEEQQLQEQQETHGSEPEIVREVDTAQDRQRIMLNQHRRIALALERKEVKRRSRILLPVV